MKKLSQKMKNERKQIRSLHRCFHINYNFRDIDILTKKTLSCKIIGEYINNKGDR